MRDSFDEVSVAVRADAAGRGIESALARAAKGGRLEFEDLARVAARALGEIAAAALKIEFGGGSAGGVGSLLAGLAGVSGLPGRATGGPVAPGRAYVVGEQGPEVFVPTSSGRVEAGRGRGPQVVNLAVNLGGGTRGGPAFMAQTGNQVARAVKRALLRSEH